MTPLSQFLLENPVEGITREVVVSSRLKDHPFTIKAMSAASFAEYQRGASRQGPKGAEFDTARFNELVVIGQTADPNFKDAAFVQQSGCTTPEQLLAKVLLAGEIALLARKIAELSGFGGSLSDEVEQAKNS